MPLCFTSPVSCLVITPVYLVLLSLVFPVRSWLFFPRFCPDVLPRFPCSALLCVPGLFWFCLLLFLLFLLACSSRFLVFFCISLIKARFVSEPPKDFTYPIHTNGVSGPVRCWCLKSTGFSCSHRSGAASKLRNPVRFEHQKVVRLEARTAYVTLTSEGGEINLS